MIVVMKNSLALGDISSWQDIEGNLILDTATTQVDIRNAFIGPVFVTADGEQLGVCMRDSGFDLTYIVNGREQHIVLNAGEVKRFGEKVAEEDG